MANNYCEMSVAIYLKPEQVARAKEIISLVEEDWEENSDYDYLPVVAEVVQYESEREPFVWLHHDEYADPEAAESVARSLVDELGITEPVVLSWAYTCSKPRIDEFGGGACCVIRGQETQWFDARSLAERCATNHTDRKRQFETKGYC